MTMKLTAKPKSYEKILQLISRDFDRRILGDPEFGEGLPERAYIVFQLSIPGAEDPRLLDEVRWFNRWVRELCRPQIDPDHRVVEAVLTLTSPPVSVHPERPFRRSLSQRMIKELPREFELVPA